MFALVVELHVRPEMHDRFLAAIGENSAASVRDEPGCLRFDVLQDDADPDHFFLYEIYADDAAFQAHRAAPHFLRWREAAAVCLREGDGQRNVHARPVFPRDHR